MKKCKLVFACLSVVSMSSFSLAHEGGRGEARGLGFRAPQVAAEGNVSSPEIGEIIYDTGAGTFKGRTATPAWVPFSTTPFVGVKRGISSAASWATVGGVIDYDAPIFDTNNGYNTTTDEYTCPYTGYYRVTHASHPSSGAGVNFGMKAINVNTSQTYYISNVTSGIIYNGSTILQCALGERLRMYPDNTGDLSANSWFEIVLLK